MKNTIKNRPDKPRIGIIGLKGLPAYVGAGTVGENIINCLKDNFDFYVYATSSHTSLKSGIFNGVYQKVFRKLPFKRLNAFWYYMLAALHARFIEKFDLVHVHNSFAAFTIIFLKKKYPVVLTTHGSFNIVDKWKKYEWFWRYNNTLNVKKADYLCCVSKFEKRRFKELYDLEAHYIPNGINPIDIIGLPEIEIKEPYIFFGAGRIIRSKGLHDLLSALKKLNYSGKLLVAGDIDQIAGYKEEIMKMSVDLSVEFIGLIKEKDKLFSYIKNALLFIYPSYVEAMSMMLLEAVTVECPILCSDIIGNRDIFNDDEVLFFKTQNSEDLANKLEWALQNLEKMKDKALKAKEKSLNVYNWKTISELYKEIYLKILGL